jgi:hypothetical protein
MKRKSEGVPTNDLPVDVSAPARRALEAAGWLLHDQFTKLAEKDLLALHGVGPKTIRQLKRDLAEKGLSLAG